MELAIDRQTDPLAKPEGGLRRTPPVRIFISYRREDTAPYAGRLYDAMIQRFGEGQVFMDIDTMEPGAEFVDVINRAVGSCDVLVALIGRNWLSATDAKGRRRLDRGDDFVRLEIESVLRRRAVVIPALVQDTDMPSPEELPPSLAELARRQAAVLSDRRWRTDVASLMGAIERATAGLVADAAVSSAGSEGGEAAGPEAAPARATARPATEGDPSLAAAREAADRRPAVDGAGEPAPAGEATIRELLPRWRPTATALGIAGILLLVGGSTARDGEGNAILGHFDNGFGVQVWLALRPVVMSAVTILAVWALYRGDRARRVGVGLLLGLGGAAALGYLGQVLFGLHSLGSLEGPNQLQGLVCFLGAACIGVAGVVGLPGRWDAPRLHQRWVDRRPVVAIIGAGLVGLGALVLFVPVAFWAGTPDNPLPVLVFLPELALVAGAAAVAGRTLVRSGANRALLGGGLIGLGVDGLLVGLFFFGSQTTSQYIFNRGAFNWTFGGMMATLGGLVIVASGALVALAERTTQP